MNELVTLTDGTNSVNFLSGEGADTGYVKANLEGLDPPPCEIRYAGGKPVYRKWLNRDITVTFGIKASSASDLSTKQRAIITILENTYRYWTTNGKEGLKAQLQYRRPGGTNTSYIDIYSGECDWGRVEQQAAAPYVYKLAGAQLTLTCEPCFHPSAVVNLVNEQTVYNHYDSGHVNYIDIAAANILGDLDAPCNIRIKPATTFSGGIDIDKFWVAMVGPSANIIHWGEISYYSSYDATRSQNNKYIFNSSYAGWITPGQSKQWLIRLSAAEWRAMAGHNWNILAMVCAGSTSLQWRFWAGIRQWIGDPGAEEIAIGIGDGIYHPQANQWCAINLGTLYLTHPMSGDYSGDKLFIGIQFNPGGINQAVQIDSICLVPTGNTAMIDKHLTALAYYLYVTTTDALYIKDAVDFPHHVFTESYAGPENIGAIGASQRGICPRLKPGKDNRAIFLFAEDDNVHNITRQFKVTIDYLPQYLTPME